MSDAQPALRAIFGKYGLLYSISEFLKSLNPPVLSIAEFANIAESTSELRGDVFAPANTKNESTSELRVSLNLQD